MKNQKNHYFTILKKRRHGTDNADNFSEIPEKARTVHHNTHYTHTHTLSGASRSIRDRYRNDGKKKK